MRAKSMTDKFMELDGLIRACLPHMNDPQAAKRVLDMLNDTALRDDILTKNADKFFAGVPVSVLEMNECWRRYPVLADIWEIVQKDLVKSGLLPWAMQYPDKILHSAFMQQIVNNIETLNFEADSIPIRSNRGRPELAPRPIGGSGSDDQFTRFLLSEGAPKAGTADQTLCALSDSAIKPTAIPDFSQPPGEDDPVDGPSAEEINAGAATIKEFLKKKRGLKLDR
jgi:hypothetical protein